MSSIFFTPPPVYVPQLKLKKYLELEELCRNANISCVASGAWTRRKVEILHGEFLQIEAEPGDWGSVRITMKTLDKIEAAKTALLILAYSLHDLVAKQSINGTSWSRIPMPKGRIRTGLAMSNAQRQRKFRQHQTS